jgi:hypothetical protein
MRFAPAPAALAEETPPWEDDPAEQPEMFEPDSETSGQPEQGEAPGAGAPVEPDGFSPAVEPERGGAGEDAPPAEQEEMKEAA